MPLGNDPAIGQDIHDYHFVRQTSTGQWAEKQGTGGAAILWDVGVTPNATFWLSGGEPYYDSDIIYTVRR